MRWKIHGRRTMYESDWVNVYLDDVELPDGTHIDHHVLTMPKASQTAIVLNEERDQVLLIWRHRFITNRWGWEVPAGWAEKGEDLRVSIQREVLEETGHAVDDLIMLFQYDAIPGISTMHFTAWLTYGARRVTDAIGEETDKVAWHNISELPDLLRQGAVIDGPSLATIAYFIATSHSPTK